MSGTPTGDSPAEPTAPNWDDPSNPYIQRHKDTQAAYTRSQQILADPDALLEYVEQNHPDLLEDDGTPVAGGEPNNESPELAALRQELAALRKDTDTVNQWRQQQTEAQGREAVYRDLDQFAKDKEVTLSDREKRNLLRDALDLVGNGEEFGPQHVQKAFDDHLTYVQGIREAALEAKRSRPRVPHIPSGGRPVEGAKPFHEMTDSERLAYQMERLNSAAG